MDEKQTYTRPPLRSLPPKWRDFLTALRSVSGALEAMFGGAARPYILTIAKRLKWTERKARRVAGQLQREGFVECDWGAAATVWEVEYDPERYKVYMDIAEGESKSVVAVVPADCVDKSHCVPSADDD